MKKILFFLFFCMFPAFFYAQSAEKLFTIMSAPQATYGHAAYLCATASGLVSDSASYEESLETLKENGYLAAAGSADDSIPVKRIAELCTDVWNIQESIMARIFPCTHYKLRQMQAYGLIPQKFDRNEVPTGRELLTIISKCAENYPLPVKSAAEEAE